MNEIQTKLFPEFPPHFFAYEVDWFGGDDNDWEVFVDDEPTPFVTVKAADFGDWLDFVRECGYDVYINTLESWEAMIDV